MKVVSSKIARAISAGKAHHGYDGCYVKPVGYMSVMIRKRSGSISNWWRAIRKRKRSRLWRSCDAWPYARGIACAQQKNERRTLFPWNEKKNEQRSRKQHHIKTNRSRSRAPPPPLSFDC